MVRVDLRIEFLATEDIGIERNYTINVDGVEIASFKAEEEEMKRLHVNVFRKLVRFIDYLFFGWTAKRGRRDEDEDRSR